MSQNVCNICGANYEYHNGRWKCPACGAFKAEELSNEEVTLLYNAAQKLRLSDFDEAEKAYADIIEKFPKNPDGYWGRLLSRYGIKYEEDFDGRKIPTCYATSIESVITDKDYLKAIELADQETRAYYTLQAEYIERVRKEWVEKAKKEKPYDIFICYKDSDLANGIDRTQDSIAAQELYIHLTEQGYRVFFSRESLRGKVGEKYEPYIFNALSTAKVMLVYGSKSEYITSTWLKNEWTRYEKRLQAGEKKPNSLIVACDGFSPNELPKVLSSMQCFDATSRSFYTDLDAVLKKIIKGEEKPKPVAEPKPEKKKSKKLPIAIASIATVIAIFLCILLPNVLGNKPSATITDSKYGVVISADSEIFDKNTSVIVDKLTDGAQYTALVSTVSNSKSVEIKNAIIYDIKCDADITKNVTIKVAYSKSSADSTVKVYYVSDDKTLIEEHSCIYDDGFVQFKTNHLSYYVVGEIVPPSNPGGNDNPGGDDPKPPVTPSLTYEDGVLQVGVCANYEPYEYIEGGQVKGIEIDILKAIATELGLEIRFENDEFEDLLYNLNAKDVDCIIGVTETAQRNELATASKVMFRDDDMDFIIYINKDCNDLLQAVNNAIDELNTQGSILSIVDRYKNPGTVATHTATFKIDGQTVDTRTFYEGDTTLDLPALPERQCYRGEWEVYVLGKVDITINAHYYTDHESITHIPESVKTDCTQTGNIEHWYCSACEKYYIDSEGKQERSQSQIQTVAGCNFVSGSCTWCEGTEGIDYIDTGDGYYSVSQINNSSAKNIVIPEKYNGKPVKAIGSAAFLNNTTIESITFKGDIVFIGDSAFQGCSQLQSVTLSACSLTALNEQVFYECTNLETIELPTGLESIGISAFNGCTKLKYINIPSSVQTIEYGAFMNCTGLLTVSIPNNVQTLGDSAFCGCKALTTVSIGNKVETIGESTFSDCDKLTTISFGSKVTTIEDYAFARCVELKSVQLPNSLKTLGKQVFSACGNLESINIPSTVTSVGELCFWNCSKAVITCDFESKPSGWNSRWNETGGNVVWSLAKVQFLFHYEYAEGNNTQTVASVTVGEVYTLPVPTRTGYTFVGWFSEAGGKGTKYTDASGKAITAFSNNTVPICNAYAYWEGSSCLTYSGGTTNYVVYEYDSSTAGRDIYIPEYYNGLPVTGINSQAFKGYSGTVILPKSLKTIASGAFADHGMEYIVIPEGVTTINTSAFTYTDNGRAYGFTIFYEGESIPSGWAEGWNKYYWVTGSGFTTTHTGYTTVYLKNEWHYENGVPTPNNASTKVSICFDSNGGVGAMEVVYLDPNQSITLPQNNYSREGYTFKGWSKSATGGVEYNNASTFTIGDSSTVLYAVWEANENKVVFNANGGSGSMSNLIASTDETVSLPYCSFTRAGYSFAGWSTSSGGSVIYCNQDAYTMGTNASYTLYAVWNPNNNTSYTVNHWKENENGTYSVAESEVLYGTTGTKATPTPKEYTGYTTPSAKEIVILGNGSANVDYYYALKTYTVSYVTNGGETIEQQVYKHSQSITLPSTTRNGYTFLGWSSSAQGEAQYQAGFYAFATQNHTFYAVWQENYRYTSNGDYITVSSYKGNEENIVVPSSIDGLPVKYIGEQCFWNCTAKTITISNGIESIGNQAFNYCYNLESLSIPQSVTSIGIAIFAPGSNKINNITIDLSNAIYEAAGNCIIEKASKKLIVGCSNSIIPDGIISIGSHAFSHAEGLTTLSIPEGVLQIEEWAFNRCLSLNSIELPSSLVKIGSYAFYECPTLVHVTNLSGISFTELPKNPNMEIRTSTAQSFKNTVAADGDMVKYTVGNTIYLLKYLGSSETIDLTSTNYTAIYQYAFFENQSIKQVVISDKITSIGNYAFCNSRSIKKMVIGNKVGTIGDSAFSYCTELNELTIGASVTSIGQSAFNGCSSLTTIVIPENVAYIGAYAFEGSGLTTAVFEDTVNWYVENKVDVSNFSTNAFLLKDTFSDKAWEKLPVNVEYTVKYWQENADNDQYTVVDTQTLYGTPGEVVTPTVNSYSNFISPSAQTFTIKEGETIVIDYYYKRETISISFVTNGGEDLDTQTYKYGQTENYSIPNRNGYTFGGWYTDEKLTNVAPSKPTTNLTLYAWWTEETKPSNLFNYSVNEGIIIVEAATTYPAEEFELNIPSYIGGLPVTQIADDAFSFRDITVLTIPDSIECIGKNAFSGCDTITQISIGSGVKTIGDGAFSNCTKVSKLTYNAENAEDLSESGNVFYGLGTATNGTKLFIGEKVCRIPANFMRTTAFDVNNITTIEFAINSNLKEIRDFAFYDCSELTGIVIPNSVTNIGECAFYSCNAMANVTLSNTLDSIGLSAFYGCSFLETIDIPDSVTSIGMSAFYECTKLETVLIGNGVTVISNSLFFNCTSLKNVTIGNCVETINEYAFAYCSSLESITIPNSVSKIGKQAFSGCTSLASAKFINTSGWRVSSSGYNTGGATIYVSTESTAANYLKSTHYDKYWWTTNT